MCYEEFGLCAHIIETIVGSIAIMGESISLFKEKDYIVIILKLRTMIS